MEDDEECITGLSLGLGTGGNNNNVPKKEKQKVMKNKSIVANSLDLPLELCPEHEDDHDESIDNKKPEILSLHHQRNDEEGHKHCPNSKSSDDSSNSKNCSIRKKLRLTKEQLSMLETSFKLHTTLNSAQKQALAEQLNLKARQIEVWFQNRRARTKLKQTEVDCELLKRRCERLSEENKRLKKELQEMRGLKLAKSPLYIQLSKAAMCCSCDNQLLKPDPSLQSK